MTQISSSRFLKEDYDLSIMDQHMCYYHYLAWDANEYGWWVIYHLAWDADSRHLGGF